jgi:hypothetical protein
MISSLLELGTKDFFELNDILRLEMLERAAKNDTNVFFTFAYGGSVGDKWIRKLTTAIRRNRLYADKKVLYKRLNQLFKKKIYPDSRYSEIRTQESVLSLVNSSPNPASIH